ncbi:MULTISPECIES: Uma2 family endonuclease [Spirulina sp. CCY15215]|uniref:Uma2 family endonuclease n=1 Tax=Spirulina sp. CCY15215 TaxID=2767591 RepID=UPI001951BCFB|nr:Uma2 family endonuclease [Spirulina major]
MTNLTLDLETVNLTDEQYYQLCIKNKNLRFERNANGDLIIMSPTGDETSNRNGRLTQQLFNWSDTNELGIVFDSSGGFKLPNGAERSPDASWIPLEKWQKIPLEERERFSNICPDFVVELMSPSDSLKATQEKMQEYLDNGAKLGWLINRKKRRVEIYRQGKEVEVLNNPSTLSGEDVLLGFVLKLAKIW